MEENGYSVKNVKLLYTLLLLDLCREVHKGQHCLLIDTKLNFRYFRDSYKYRKINENTYSNFIFTLTDVLQNCNSKICTKPCLDT